MRQMTNVIYIKNCKHKIYKLTISKLKKYIDKTNY